MRALTANDAIGIWEKGQRLRPAERSVAVLSAAYPESSGIDLSRLTVGQCNARLWKVRNRIFGAAVNAFSECPNCGERLEFSFDAAGLEAAKAAEAEYELECDDYTVRFRLLSLDDLNAAASRADLETVRTGLLERCVLEANYRGEPVAVRDLPATFIEKLGMQLAEFDSGSDLLINLACPVCESGYQLPFDIGAFFYTEISAQAQRLLREVHMLAHAYSWHERDILGMSARRRHFYLQMLER
ncbi:MAG: hypothetical protein QOK48_459 [Blastocatellia bacterium]|jgi:hypothetical protein|nr:hypothetical protein [Blastocatellia bacterium]